MDSRIRAIQMNKQLPIPLPCPFCGESPGLAGLLFHRHVWQIVCICSANGPVEETRRLAIESWNRRAVSHRKRAASCI